MKTKEEKQFKTNEFNPQKYFRDLQEQEKIKNDEKERKEKALLSLELSN